MSFEQSVRTCFGKYATFSGRAGRPEFWWFALLNVVLSSGASIIDFAMGSGSIHLGWTLTLAQGPVQTVVTLALLLPTLAVGSRRLHDVGHSAWWLLIGLVPCVGFIVLLIFFCTSGDRYPNAYGDVPA